MPAPERTRKSLRLVGFDYSQAGAYFVTICLNKREHLLARVEDARVALTPFGILVSEAWVDLPRHYRNVSLDTVVIMPDHLHGIIALSDCADRAQKEERAGLRPAPTDPETNALVGAGLRPALPPAGKMASLSEVIRALKTFSARRINELRGTPGEPLWQRGYYEHVIRNGRELNFARRYIHNNPLQWTLDDAGEFPINWN